MHKTKIDWCDSTWNPITGCLHGCEYCYARSIAKRFGGANDGEVDYEGEAIWTFEGKETGGCHVIDEPAKWYSDDGRTFRKAPYPFYFDPTFHRYRLDEYQNKKGRNIFVCSMADLFGDWVPDEWIEEVFAACDKAPQHNYMFLTKNVKRYVKQGVPMLENMWYETSITRESDMHLFNSLPACRNTFVSIEPILQDLEVEKHNTMFRLVDWFIIGAETGRRKNKVVPERKWIEDIVSECRKHNKPVFMKSSLADIWGEQLIQEFPETLRR
ncbi:MAG: DUF5131 family protein [Eubacteriales bacterium]|nr:DUF5131 family protein [Eubacteriales bacterium]